MQHRRLAAVQVTGAALKAVICGVARPFMTDFPRDAELVDVFMDSWSRCAVAIFQHESFDLVPEGVVIPIRAVTLTET